jgi:hypothetical protein
VAGEPRLIGRATVLSLVLVAVLFILQTYLAALLMPGTTQFGGEDATNNAFYTVSGVAAGHWMLVVVAVTTALAAAAANTWSRRRPPRGCSTRWAGTAPCRSSWRRSARSAGCRTARCSWWRR